MTRMIAPLDERARAYDRMAHALNHLGDTWRDWPDLASVAAAMNLSPSHFQREFTRWAGISPKQFQAALAHGEAGELLRDGASVLDAALETGLSGPGRLHDLFIAHEGLTPGEAKAGGAGADLILGKAPTPFGMGAWLIGQRGLVGLGFIDEGAPKRTGFEYQGVGEAQAFADLIARYPDADIRRDDAVAERFARKVFESGEPMPVALYGTPFRRQVWRALLEIPAGTTQTYGQLARAAGNPNAARAVGAAVGANPISWFIPCHRALAADGRLHNYHWGVARKRAMLTFERAHAA
ncbi:bifunctional helix-turn-helix domain-containing protein/methylated-DNA--[protein]-cysteine S-methyltransferase [Hyphomonas sp.]|uniref:bifunctional helix-turn-helix domain-containing protein/methylated-DNA--[protein]-cysteine S-methyltransferase n=1 Tax=Hyphomonas sp. TaxID=87 RepID=UPI0032EC2885